MGRGLGRCVGSLALGLALASPASALPPARPAGQEAGALPTPPPPDPGTFDALLLDLARPRDRAHPQGLTTSRPDLAIRAGTQALLPSQPRSDPSSSLQMMGPEAQALALAELPAGQALAGFLDPSGSHPASELHLKDVAPLALGPQGPLRRAGRAVLGSGLAGSVGGSLLVVGATAALAAELGTAQASALGLTPAVRSSWLDNGLELGAALRCDPHLANPAADASGRYRLLRIQSPAWQPWLRELNLEAGATAVRTGDHLQLGWGKLHAGNGWLDAAAGLVASPSGPATVSLETTATHDALRLHLQLNEQPGPGVAQGLGALAWRAGPAELGLFFGGHTQQGSSAGVLALGSF